MKKLKKFNENWIDDETEDTNRRMSELDDKPVDELEFIDDDEMGLRNNIIDLIHQYAERFGTSETKKLLVTLDL